MGVASIDQLKDTTCCLSPKIYQPPSEDMEAFLDSPKKKKTFSSSSFYEEPSALYPTVEEQVELARKIAGSLSDECNLKSKGANMFFKRVKKAEKWIVAESSLGPEVTEPPGADNTDPSQLPYVRPAVGLPKLKLVLDPRGQLVDMKRLLREGVDIVQHNAVSPEVCHDLVKDLNSPTGRGAQLFARRKKKSVEWVVDEEKVKALLRERQGGYSSPESPDEFPTYTKINSVNAPKSQLDSLDVAETVIRAAEAKIMTYPAPQMPVLESWDQVAHESRYQQQSSLVKSPTCPALTTSHWSGAYQYRAPKGWTSSHTSATPAAGPVDTSATTTDFLTSLHESQTARLSSVSPANRQSNSNASPVPRTFNFTNFNASPRAWNASSASSQFQSFAIKTVKPPVFVQ